MSLKEQIETLKLNVASAEAEFARLELGTKASAPRLRKNLMDIKKTAHAARTATTAHVKTLPTKPRAKKAAEPKPEPVAEPAPEPALEPVAEH